MNKVFFFSKLTDIYTSMKRRKVQYVSEEVSIGRGKEKKGPCERNSGHRKVFEGLCEKGKSCLSFAVLGG